MIDVTDRLVAFVKSGLEEELNLISSELLGGQVENMERYRYLMGKREGLVLAHRGIDTALRKLRDDYA